LYPLLAKMVEKGGGEKFCYIEDIIMQLSHSIFEYYNLNR